MSKKANGKHPPQTKANGKDAKTAPAAAAPADPGMPMAETLSGDLRDRMLELFKEMAVKPWAKMSEGDQRVAISRFNNAAIDFVQAAVPLIRAQGGAFVACKVKKVTVEEKGIALQLGHLPSVAESPIDLVKLYGSKLILIEAGAAKFLGERAPARPDPDQRSLNVEIDKQHARQAMDQAATPKDGKPKLPREVAATIGDRLYEPPGDLYVPLGKNLLANLRQELARDPSRIVIVDDSGAPEFSIALGDSQAWLVPVDAACTVWQIGRFHAAGSAVTYGAEAMKGVSDKLTAFVKDWLTFRPRPGAKETQSAANVPPAPKEATGAAAP